MKFYLEYLVVARVQTSSIYPSLSYASSILEKFHKSFCGQPFSKFPLSSLKKLPQVSKAHISTLSVFAWKKSSDLIDEKILKSVLIGRKLYHRQIFCIYILHEVYFLIANWDGAKIGASATVNRSTDVNLLIGSKDDFPKSSRQTIIESIDLKIGKRDVSRKIINCLWDVCNGWDGINCKSKVGLILEGISGIGKSHILKTVLGK